MLEVRGVEGPSAGFEIGACSGVGLARAYNKLKTEILDIRDQALTDSAPHV